MELNPDQIESMMEGRKITQIIPLLRSMLDAAPLDVPQLSDAIRATDHVFTLATKAEREKDARVICDFTRPRFDTRDTGVYIPAPLGPEYYVVALHEFGHLFGPGQEDQAEFARRFDSMKPEHPEFRRGMRAVVTAEMGAWQWAIENAVVWTEDMGRRGGEAFLSYFMHEVTGTDNVRQDFYNTLEMIVRFRK